LGVAGDGVAGVVRERQGGVGAEVQRSIRSPSTTA
jgi:hypothetical protein